MAREGLAEGGAASNRPRRSMFQAVGRASAKCRKWKYDWLLQRTASRPEWPKRSRERVAKDEVEDVGWGVGAFRATNTAMRVLALSFSRGMGAMGGCGAEEGLDLASVLSGAPGGCGESGLQGAREEAGRRLLQ